MERRDHLCSACALFGMVPREGQDGKKAEGGARASKVRFEDAALINPSDRNHMKECYWPEMTLPEMGEPKPSAVEFYTVPLDGEKVKKSSYGHWTYDIIKSLQR